MTTNDTTTTTTTNVRLTDNVDELMMMYKTKSAVIRYLSSQGMSRSNIATLLGIRYQHVRNVLTQPLKKV